MTMGSDWVAATVPASASWQFHLATGNALASSGAAHLLAGNNPEVVKKRHGRERTITAAATGRNPRRRCPQVERAVGIARKRPKTTQDIAANPNRQISIRCRAFAFIADNQEGQVLPISMEIS